MKISLKFSDKVNVLFEKGKEKQFAVFSHPVLNKRYCLTLLLLFCLLIGLPQPGYSNTEPGSISGTITATDTGQTLADILVQACSSVYNCVRASTDAEGKYTITGLDPYDYKVEASVRGVRPTPAVAQTIKSKLN